MKNCLGLLIAFSAVACTAAAPSLQVRQASDLERVQKIIDDARAASIAKLKADETSQGRQLLECSAACSTCRAGALATAIGEVALCGVAALGLEAVTLGTTTILELVGFAACEVSAVGTLTSTQTSCNSLP